MDHYCSPAQFPDVLIVHILRSDWYSPGHDTYKRNDMVTFPVMFSLRPYSYLAQHGSPLTIKKQPYLQPSPPPAESLSELLASKFMCVSEDTLLQKVLENSIFDMGSRYNANGSGGMSSVESLPIDNKSNSYVASCSSTINIPETSSPVKRAQVDIENEVNSNTNNNPNSRIPEAVSDEHKVDSTPGNYVPSTEQSGAKCRDDAEEETAVSGELNLSNISSSSNGFIATRSDDAITVSTSDVIIGPKICNAASLAESDEQILGYQSNLLNYKDNVISSKTTNTEDIAEDNPYKDNNTSNGTEYNNMNTDTIIQDTDRSTRDTACDTRFKKNVVEPLDDSRSNNDNNTTASHSETAGSHDSLITTINDKSCGGDTNSIIDAARLSLEYDNLTVCSTGATSATNSNNSNNSFSIPDDELVPLEMMPPSIPPLIQAIKQDEVS